MLKISGVMLFASFMMKQVTFDVSLVTMVVGL